MLLTLTVPAVLTPLASAIVTVDRASNAPRNSPRNSLTGAGSNFEFDLLIFSPLCQCLFDIGVP
ncbi:MAG: hypothetical protein QG574_1685 [Cyanobacteriota bacterium erpe_2018_sw_21hr_WHONDRS-SW48-000092_B_bin.40]|nr:hypothetical protein [Cyanobacteriota bacterium erpe_2018_sw_21hr_WHONDRS-SW48-000092_B_bin.40]